MNIGLVNEMKVVADRMGIDIFEVVDAAATNLLDLPLIIQGLVWEGTVFPSILST